jgi:hypothetical protein
MKKSCVFHVPFGIKKSSPDLGADGPAVERGDALCVCVCVCVRVCVRVCVVVVAVVVVVMMCVRG